MTALALSAIPADAAVTGGESIEVFTGSNLISLTGYPANTRVEVEVLRQGFVIGRAVKTTDASGIIEMNHVGAEADDCFDPPSTPDVMPRDTIRTSVVGDAANVDTSVVRGLWIDDIDYGGTTITVSGRVALAGPAKVVPGKDVLELRINKSTAWDVNDRPGRRDRREDIGASVNPDGSWTHVITASAQDVAEAQAESETFLEWSSAAGAAEAFPPELTVAEFGAGEALVGCPPMQQGPTAPQLSPAQDSGTKGDHVTNQSANLTFAGLAGSDAEGDDAEPGPGADVRLLVDGSEKGTGTANAQGVYEFTGVTLTPGVHQVSVESADPGASGPTFTSTARKVTVDTAAPAMVLRQWGPTPLELTGTGKLRAVYRVSETARLTAMVQHLSPLRTVRTFAARNIRSAGLVEYLWNGKNDAHLDVNPGSYRLVVTATDKAGNVKTAMERFRVVR